MNWILRLLACVVAFVLLLSGCASYDIYEKGSKGVAWTEIEEDAPARQTDRECLSKSDYDTVEAINDRQILFHGIEDNVWINELAERCPDLETYDALAFEKHSTLLCERDEVVGVNRALVNWAEGPSCTLGRFERIYELERDKTM